MYLKYMYSIPICNFAKENYDIALLLSYKYVYIIVKNVFTQEFYI